MYVEYVPHNFMSKYQEGKVRGQQALFAIMIMFINKFLLFKSCPKIDLYLPKLIWHLFGMQESLHYA